MSSSGHDLLFDWVLPDVRWRIAYNIIMAGFNHWNRNGKVCLTMGHTTLFFSYIQTCGTRLHSVLRASCVYLICQTQHLEVVYPAAENLSPTSIPNGSHGMDKIIKFYICIVLGDPIIRGGVGTLLSSLTLTHCNACSKPESVFPTQYMV